MPWCPVCKNEYKDGYTLCADCGAELVDFLSDDSVKLNEVEDTSTEMSKEEVIDSIDDIALKLGTYTEEELSQLVDKKEVKESVRPFVKASERAENYKSSAFALLFVGIVGAAFLILSYLKIIPLNLAANISVIFYVVMGLMFAAFIIIGIKSLSSAKAIASTADKEDTLTTSIYSYFKDNHTAQSIDELAFADEAPSLSDEEKYFPRSNTIKKLITDNFGELDDAYLTELCENAYADLFEA